MRSCLCALVLLTAAAPTFALAEDAVPARSRPVSSAELVILLSGANPPRVYDVRVEEEFGRAHLPGSTLLPWGNDPAGFVAGLPADKSQPIALYCNGPT